MEAAQFADPYALARALRAEGEVVPKIFRVEAGFEQPAALAGVEEWTALSYEAARTILVDNQTFSSRAYASQHDKKMGAATILSMDEPEHRAHRDLISAGFFARNIRESTGKMVPQVLDHLIDGVIARGQSVDLVEDLTSIFPIQVIVALVGVPASDWPQFLRWIDDLVQISARPQAALAAGAEVQAYLKELVKARRARPLDDLASTLIAAEVNGEKLSDPSIVAFLALLLTAGGETTVRALGTTLLGLLQDPDQLALVRDDPSLVSRALEEGMRWDTPVQMIRRVATRTTEVCGAKIPEGAHIQVHLGSANRDPARWSDPDRYDMRRPPLPHISFGVGVHFCLGMNLARFEAETGIAKVLERLPGLRLAPGAQPVVRGVDLRGPDRLEVAFDPVPVHA